MSKSYVIHWKSKVNGRAGKGTRMFDRAEAEELAAELNHEYPEIEHEARDTVALAQAGAQAIVLSGGEPAGA